VAVSCIGGRNRSTRRKQPICRKSLTHFITYCCIEHTSDLGIMCSTSNLGTLRSSSDLGILVVLVGIIFSAFNVRFSLRAHSTCVQLFHMVLLLQIAIIKIFWILSICCLNVMKPFQRPTHNS